MFIKTARTSSESIDEVERDASACSKIDDNERDASACWELVHQDWSARAERGSDGGRRWADWILGVYAAMPLLARWRRARARRRSTKQVF